MKENYSQTRGVNEEALLKKFDKEKAPPGTCTHEEGLKTFDKSDVKPTAVEEPPLKHFF